MTLKQIRRKYVMIRPTRGGWKVWLRVRHQAFMVHQDDHISGARWWADQLSVALMWMLKMNKGATSGGRKLIGLESDNAKLARELSEMKDYANALFALCRDFMPICPVKAKKAWDYAKTEGQKLRDKYKAEAEKRAEKAESELVAARAEIARLKAERGEATTDCPIHGDCGGKS